MPFVNFFAILLTYELLTGTEPTAIPVFDTLEQNSSRFGRSFEDEMVDVNVTYLDHNQDDTAISLAPTETVLVNGYYNVTSTATDTQRHHTLSNKTELLTMSPEEEGPPESVYTTTNNDTEDEEPVFDADKHVAYFIEIQEQFHSSTTAIPLNESTSQAISNIDVHSNATEQMLEVTEFQPSPTRNISFADDFGYGSMIHSVQNQTELLTTSPKEKDIPESAYTPMINGTEDGLPVVDKENQTTFFTISSEEESLSESAYTTTNNGTDNEDSVFNEEEQTEDLNTSSEKELSTESGYTTTNNDTETLFSSVTEIDQSHTEMDLERNVEPELSSVIEHLGQLLEKLGLNSTGKQSYGYATALKSPDGSLYIPHQQNQSKEKHIETLLGFAEEILKGKDEMESSHSGKDKKTTLVGENLMASSTTSSYRTTDNCDELLSYDNEEGHADTNTTFTFTFETTNVSLGPVENASTALDEYAANDTLGTRFAMDESTEDSNRFTTENDHAVNVTDSSDVSSFSTATQDPQPTDGAPHVGHFSPLSSKLTLIHEQLYNRTEGIMQYFTAIARKIGGALNQTL